MIALPSGDVWPEMIQGSEEWFSARKGRATASQFKNILTPTWKLSAQSVAYARKLARECVLDDPLEFTGNKATDWGNEHEPAARQEFMDATGNHVAEVGFVTHQTMTCVGCSPDGIVLDGDGIALAGLEIKCPSIGKLVDWKISGQVPAEHLPQIHGSMIVTGLRMWHFAAYFPGVPVMLGCVEWDSYTDKLKEVLEGFVIRYAEIRPTVLEVLGKGLP